MFCPFLCILTSQSIETYGKINLAVMCSHPIDANRLRCQTKSEPIWVLLTQSGQDDQLLKKMQITLNDVEAFNQENFQICFIEKVANRPFFRSENLLAVFSFFQPRKKRKNDDLQKNLQVSYFVSSCQTFKLFF